jgi:adenosine deaminase CECR1
MSIILAFAILVSGYAEDRENILEQAYMGTELTADEMIADSIFQDLKQGAMGLQDPWDPWVSQFFPIVREDYENTSLFYFLREMPKGAVLHVHPSAMGNYYELFDMVCGREDCYYNPSTESFMLFLDSVPGSEWHCVPELLARAPDEAVMRDSLLDCITIDVGDENLPDIWAEFESMFGRVGGLFADPAVVRSYIYNSLYYYAAVDHINHIELRVHSPSSQTVDFYLAMVDSLAGNGIDISIRIVSCDSRYIFPGETVQGFRDRILTGLKKAADLMALYPGIVIGADVYSEEDKGATAHYMAPLMQEAREYSMTEYGFELPLYLHDGESSFPTGVSDSPISETGPYPGNVNNNVIDAYLLNVERVGHGIELAKLPELAFMYAERGTPLEICPVSNQVLGYVSDLRDHPAVTLMRSGVRISLNPDDPAMFGYTGVTHDFMVATLAWDLSLGDVKRIIMNSIEDAAMTDAEKAELMALWETEWNIFIDEVVSSISID